MTEVSLLVRLPGEMREELRVLSKANNRSMNGQVVEELRKAIKRSKAPSNPDRREMMNKLQVMSAAIRSMQNSGIELKEISVSAEDREELIFLMMKIARDIPSPTKEMAKRFSGELNIFGVCVQ